MSATRTVTTRAKGGGRSPAAPRSGRSGARLASVLLAFALALVAGRAAPAAPAPAAAPRGEAKPVSYWRDVRPILQERCQGCHQPARSKGHVDVTSAARLGTSGEEDERAVVPGKPEESLLWQEIVPDGDSPPSMPKGKDPLSEAQARTIAQWIREGAIDDSPADQGPEYSSEHPPVYFQPPVVTSLDVSPDGRWIAVSGHHEVVVHRADGSGIEARLVGLSERIESVVFSPEGRYLAVTGGSPGRQGEVQVWSVARKRLRVSVPVGHDTVYGASWSPDGKLVAFGCSDNTLRAIEASSGKQVLYQGAHNDCVLDTAFSRDASHLVSVSRDRSLKLTEVDTQQFIDNITSITPGALRGGLMAVDRHPDRDEVLVGGADGAPKIYRMHREKARKIGDDYNLIRKFESLPGRVYDVEYSRDGARIAAVSSFDREGELRVFEAGDGRRLSRLHLESGLFAVGFHPDGKTVCVAGFDGFVRIVAVETGEVVKKFCSVPLTF